MTTEDISGREALLGKHPATNTAASDLDAQWDTRRVLAVNLHNKAVMGRDGASETLGSMIRAHGYDLDDVAVMFCYSRETVQFAWPRNVSWKSLPIIGDPVYRVQYCGRSLLAENPTERQNRFTAGTSPKDGRMFGYRTELLVIASEELSSRDLYDVEMMRRQDLPAVHPMILHFDGQSLREIDPKEVSAAWEKHYPDERFVYNHALNLLVIGARAYVSIARDCGEDQKHVETWMPQFHSVHWKFGHPLGVQVLCALGRRPGSEPTTWFRDVPQKDEWLWANRSMIFERTVTGDRFRWVGSGRYPAWTDMIVPHVNECETKIEGTDFTRSYVDEIVGWMSSLNFAGFVCLDQDGSVCLTSKGRRYMEIVAPALEDPDVLLRWRTDDLLCSMKDIPAVDRWMNRAFRKLKRAVANLPSSPVNEDAVDPWPEYRTNVFLVRGRKIDVTDEMLADDAFVAEVARIETMQAAIPVAEWRKGVIRRPLGFGVQGRVDHVWAGVPLAIFADQHKDIGRYELLADWTEVDDEIAGLKVKHWPELAEGVVKVLAFDEPDRDPVTFVTPGRLMAEDEHTCPVIFGRVLSLELPLRDESIAHALKYQEIAAGFMGRQVDGIRIFGKGPCARHRTVSIGVQVGSYDPHSGSAILETAFCELRGVNLKRIFRSRKAGETWEAVLDHPGLSEEGYRIMLPNGRFIEIPVDEAAAMH